MPAAPPAFAPTRAAALERLAAFLPRAGRDYAALRNHDLPGHPHVSRLSPWLRHRILTEAEVLAAVVGRHGAAAAGKFVDEVFWRTYWKGWLERRPAVWAAYRAGLARALDRLAAEGGLRRDWEAACRGETGIDAFDAWARELVATGWLHNHARMWFASIWVFTLRLPWELGADFFLRHLLDGDPASNTLSWRWVAGLHTPGKTYRADPDNIARYTGGRFRPQGLAAEAPPLPGPPNPAAGPVPQGDRWDPAAPSGLLVTEEDLSPGFLLAAGLRPAAVAVLSDVAGRSPLAVAPAVHAFTAGALADAAARLAPSCGAAETLPGWQALPDWAADRGLAQLVTPWAPVGPVAGRLHAAAPALAARGIRLVRVLRGFDARAWPHAARGFFQFREAIPMLLAGLSAPDAAPDDGAHRPPGR
jgi:deoxyribodipyrimidine photo-lyase